jgi:ABC-type phosphate transport system ATPase subunit
MVGWIAARLESERPRGARLVVTHDLGLARRIADEAALLVEGRIVECAEIVTFFENPGQARTREFTRLGS